MIFCSLVTSYQLEKDLESGISLAMKNYKSRKFYQIAINELQFNYECCGATTYTNWFTIKSASSGKDVPFSCCKMEHSNPCQNEDIEESDENESIYIKGCVTPFAKSLKTTIYLVAFLCGLLLVVELITFVVFKYWSTSVENALELGDSTQTVSSWLFGKSRKLMTPPENDDSSIYSASDYQESDNQSVTS